MAYDDLPLGTPTGSPAGSTPPASTPPSSATRWVIAVAAVVIVGGGLYFWWLSRIPSPPATPPVATATDVAVGGKRPTRQPLELPSLDQSDTFVREMVATLSKHPQLARFLATKQIINTVVLAAEQIGNGKTPAVPFKALRPGMRLMIIGQESGRIDPASYVRWESDVASLVSVKPDEAAQLYVNLKPLFDQAYADLGHAGGDFDTSIAKAIKMLADTPEPTEEPVLMKRPAYFEHTDAALRSLKPVQKQFLLLGGERRTRVRQWMQSFARALALKLD